MMRFSFSITPLLYSLSLSILLFSCKDSNEIVPGEPASLGKRYKVSFENLQPGGGYTALQLYSGASSVSSDAATWFATQSGYYSLGYTITENNIVKIDSTGKIVFSGLLPIMKEHFGQNIAATADGGCYLHIEKNNKKLSVIRLGSKGDILWSKDIDILDEKSYGFTIDEMATENNGGVVAIGSIFGEGYISPFVIKLDDRGNTEWANIVPVALTLNSIFLDIATSKNSNKNNIYLLMQKNTSNCILYCLGPDGAEKWSKDLVFPINVTDYGQLKNSLHVLANGNIVVNTYNAKARQLVTFSEIGEVLTAKEYNQPNPGGLFGEIAFNRKNEGAFTLQKGTIMYSYWISSSGEIENGRLLYNHANVNHINAFGCAAASDDFGFVLGEFSNESEVNREASNLSFYKFDREGKINCSVDDAPMLEEKEISISVTNLDKIPMNIFALSNVEGSISIQKSNVISVASCQ